MLDVDHHPHLVARAGNEALQVNPPNADLHLLRWGSNWDWTVFCVMGASTLGVLAWSMNLSRGHRAFHYLAAVILATSTLAYFSMASNLGAAAIVVEFRRLLAPGGGVVTRQIFYARYIDWVITTPLLVLSLLLMTALPLSTIFATIFFDLFMVICGLLGALTRSRYKWGYFTMGAAAMFYVIYVLFLPGLRSAGTMEGGFRKVYLPMAAYLAFFYLLYPICWGLSEGGNAISVSSEMLFYGILDLCTKPIFLFTMLGMLQACDYDRLGLESGKFSKGQTTQTGAVSKEMESQAQGTAAATQ